MRAGRAGYHGRGLQLVKVESGAIARQSSGRYGRGDPMRSACLSWVCWPSSMAPNCFTTASFATVPKTDRIVRRVLSPAASNVTVTWNLSGSPSSSRGAWRRRV